MTACARLARMTAFGDAVNPSLEAAGAASLPHTPPKAFIRSSRFSEHPNARAQC
jgi:hypothetical protein